MGSNKQSMGTKKSENFGRRRNHCHRRRQRRRQRRRPRRRPRRRRRRVRRQSQSLEREGSRRWERDLLSKFDVGVGVGVGIGVGVGVGDRYKNESNDIFVDR